MSVPSSLFSVSFSLADILAPCRGNRGERHIEQDERLASRHLTPDDAEKLRQEIKKVVQENKEEIFERARKARKGVRLNSEGPFALQGSMFVLAELFREKRQETEKRLIGKLNDTEQAHWKSLEGQRKWGQLHDPEQRSV